MPISFPADQAEAEAEMEAAAGAEIPATIFAKPVKIGPIHPLLRSVPAAETTRRLFNKVNARIGWAIKSKALKLDHFLESSIGDHRQILVRAVFNDFTVVHDVDIVCILDRGEPVCNNHHCHGTF